MGTLSKDNTILKNIAKQRQVTCDSLFDLTVFEQPKGKENYAPILLQRSSSKPELLH